MVKAYHYTGSDNLNRIKNSGGLVPRGSFIRDVPGLPNEMYRPVVFLLPEPRPDEWIHNQEFPGLWNFFGDHILSKSWTGKISLLELDLSAADKANVVDFVHLAKVHYYFLGKNATDSEMRARAQKYFNSRVSLLEYKGGFSIPEIIVQKSIEFNRLSVVQEYDLREFYV